MWTTARGGPPVGAPYRGPAGPGSGAAPLAPAPAGTHSGYYTAARGPTAPGRAVGSPPPAGTTPAPGRRPVPQPGMQDPWWPPTPAPGQSAGQAPAGSAWGSRG